MGLELHLALQGTQQTMGQDWDLSVLSAIGNRAHGQHTEGKDQQGVARLRS